MDLDDRELEIQLREALHRAAEPVHGEGLFKETIRNEATRRQAARTRARWTGRLILAGAAAAAALALFAMVRPDSDRVDTDGGKGPVATEPDVPTTVEPDPSEPRTDTSDVPASSTTSTAPSTTTSTTPPLPEFPPEFAGMAHGQPAWGLYLAIAPPDQWESPEIEAASAAAEAAGYGPAGGGDINCDNGATEALGVEQNSVASAVYFETEALANQAKAAFEARGTEVVGVVYVTTYCMD